MTRIAAAALRGFGFIRRRLKRRWFRLWPQARLLARLQIGLWTRFLDLVLQHSVEDAIDESARLGGAIPLGQLKRLVDGDLGGYLGAEQHFVGPKAENIAVDCGHSVQPPVLGDLGDHRVDPRLMLLDAVDQRLCKLAEFAILQKSPLNETANLIGETRRDSARPGTRPGERPHGLGIVAS